MACGISIRDGEAFKQLALEGAFGLTLAGVEGEIPSDLAAAAHNELAGSMDTPEFAEQFFFGKQGSLHVGCESDSHAAGDCWLFDIPVLDLENLATDRLLSMIGIPKSLVR